MTTLAIVLQCPSWPNKANIRMKVSFHYSYFNFFQTEASKLIEILVLLFLQQTSNHIRPILSVNHSSLRI